MLAGRLIGPIKPRSLIACGSVLAAFSLWQMSHYNLYMAESVIVWSCFVQGLGLGLITVPLTTAAFSTLDPRLRGDGTSIYSLSRNIGSSISISYVQTEFSRNAQIAHASRVEHINPYKPLMQPETLPPGWDYRSPSGLRLHCCLRREVAAKKPHAPRISHRSNFRAIARDAGGGSDKKHVEPTSPKALSQACRILGLPFTENRPPLMMNAAS
jgi:hypothetical protein